MWDETYGLAERGTVGLRMGVVVLAIVCAAVEPDEVVFREGMDKVDLCMGLAGKQDGVGEGTFRRSVAEGALVVDFVRVR
jgi:hypothetical protein